MLRVLLRCGVRQHPNYSALTLAIKLLNRHDESLLADIVPGVFDYPLQKDLTSEFLNDPRHHLAVAMELLRALFEVGRHAGCAEAWVLTERSNVAAQRLYVSMGGTEPPEETVYFSFRLDEVDWPEQASR